MTGVADKNDLPACCGMVFDFAMYLRNKGAGCIDARQPPPFRFGPDRFGDTMCREHDRCTIRNLVEFLDKDGTLRSETRHDRWIVDYLMPNENRRAKPG
jgi:hypothetical protein